jgi:hypothetical protein
VCLPEYILKMGVISVSLLDVARIQNPLPVELDICVIEVRNVPADVMDSGPKFESVPSGNQTSECATVVGKSIGSFVSSHGGALSVQANDDGMGRVQFFLNVGEPGDSGALLYVSIQMYQRLVPMAIFSGLPSVSGLGHKRAKASIIPPETMLQKFYVANASQFIKISHPICVNTKYGDVWCALEVDTPAKNNIVRLYDSWRNSFCGVFVKTLQTIKYSGDWEI